MTTFAWNARRPRDERLHKNQANTEFPIKHFIESAENHVQHSSPTTLLPMSEYVLAKTRFKTSTTRNARRP